MTKEQINASTDNIARLVKQININVQLVIDITKAVDTGEPFHIEIVCQTNSVQAETIAMYAELTKELYAQNNVLQKAVVSLAVEKALDGDTQQQIKL